MTTDSGLDSADEAICAVRVYGPSAGGIRPARVDHVVAEEPLLIRIDGCDFVTVMRTPGHDAELAAGLLFAEGLVLAPDELEAIEACSENTPNVIEVRLAPAAHSRPRVRRSLDSASSCGVCGAETIAHLLAARPAFAKAPPSPPERLAALPEEMRPAQRWFDATGGIHAAAIYDSDARRILLREDIGRHNAVDKCVGALLTLGLWPLDDCTLVVSGRVSFEIVQKALAARVQVVVGVSAPSSLAVELARRSNMGLIGFARPAGFNIYSGWT